jgi:hypothetical protein
MESKLMSVSRALVELKTLEKRIQKLINEFKPNDIAVNNKLRVNMNMSKEEFAKSVTADYQQLKDLITYRNAIKSAVVFSNAMTKVTIGKQEMTVAQAIERKTSIEIDELFVQHLNEWWSRYTNDVDKLNATLPARLDKLLEATFSKESAKVKTEEYEAVAKPFMERNQAVLIDPLNIREKIKELEDSIVEFKKEVDISLTESNARTEITI